MIACYQPRSPHPAGPLGRVKDRRCHGSDKAKPKRRDTTPATEPCQVASLCADSQQRWAVWRRVSGRRTGPISDDLYFARDGYTTMKLAWFGIFTFGSVCAFISSPSPMMPLRLSRYAVTAYTSSSVSDCGWAYGIARRT